MPQAPKMSDRKLAKIVYVDGEPYGPGEVPAKIAEQITNPKVWADEGSPIFDAVEAEQMSDEAADITGEDSGDEPTVGSSSDA